MTVQQLATPWAPHSRLYSLPGSMVVKMKLGEAPEHVPSALDVRLFATDPAKKLDGGVVDRLIQTHAGPARITRVFSAANSMGKRQAGHFDFSEDEHLCGMSRTFRVDVEPGSPIGSLALRLNEVATVENAGPNYVTALPFAAAAPAAIDMAQAWACRDAMYAREAMAYERGDAGVLVALVDSGAAAHHPEMRRRFRSGFDTVQIGDTDFGTGVKMLGDLTTPDTKPVDQYVGHGMACAGIIGAAGEAIPPGLAGDCAVMPIRVLAAARLPGKDEPVGLGAISDIDMGMKMAVELGANVINMSFGTADSALDPNMPKPHADVVRYALLRGCVLVAASGNSGREEVYWPAAFDGVIAAGSVGVEGKPSAFTTRGGHVALCAVGERVATCSLTGYQLATGTSFAAPFVSAAAALLISRARRRSYPISSGEVRRILTESATPWTDTTIQGCGSGILDAAAALRALDEVIDRSPPVEGEPDAPDITD